MVYEDESVAPAKTMLSRRKVIGTAIWAAPAITLATAAPALAASGDTLSASGTGSWNSGTSKSFKLNVTIKATSTHSTAGIVSFTLTFPASIGAVTPPAASPAGWTIPQGTIASGGSITITSTGNLTGTSTGASAPTFANQSFTATTHVANAVVSITATESGYTNGVGSITVT
jgi:hypothetical protein